MTTILINGIGSQMGSRVARLLSERQDVQVVGLERSRAFVPVLQPMFQDNIITASLDFYQVADVLRKRQVEVVIQLDTAGEDEPVRDREEALQRNVLDTMALLGACRSAGVKRVVLPGSTLVYGASPCLPSFVDEQHLPSTPVRHGIVRHYAEVENFAATFAEKNPAISVVTLRFAPLVGNGTWSPLTHYFSQHLPVTLLGFNPRIQVLHPDDAARACVLAATGTATGVFNLASHSIMPLEQAIRLAGRQPGVIPEAMIDVASLFGNSSTVLGHWPYDRDFLRYSCVVDTHRAQSELGWESQHHAEEIVRALNIRYYTHDPVSDSVSEQV